ncbi:kelch-like protein 26 [Nilaparvata lugens]|uniref:kelch-like protein 26 n=1 Tax=Nilaparvata lugens TaxID=108931 RepID=UPI00193D0AE4|nr:kelch-like protein 26 [Nilaparvata lugens]
MVRVKDFGRRRCGVGGGAGGRGGGGNQSAVAYEFESPSHTGTLLAGLNALRDKGLLLDVTLITEGQAFQAHRVVLASVSDYFRAMFTDAMLESRLSEICVGGVPAAGMRLLLDYAYSSRLTLNLDNIQDVLSAASHIQVVAVVEACSNYLQTQLDLENCVDIATLSETYSLAGLRSVVYRFMSSHLVELSQSPDFCRLSKAQLEHLLACDLPVNCSEADVLAVTLQWIDANLASLSAGQRLHWAQRLLRRVHLSEVPVETVVRGGQQCDAPLKRLLCAESCYKVGGFGIGGITNEITYFLPSTNKWRHLTSIPHVEQCNYGTAVLDNDLYVVGGCFNQSLQENIHPFGFRYNPMEDFWSTMAPMEQERCRFSLTVVGGRLWAVGGASEEGGGAMGGADVVGEGEGRGEGGCACECYSPLDDCWDLVTPLPAARTQHAAAACGHYLYVSGGLDRDTALCSVWRLDTVTGDWEQRADMPVPRVDHTMMLVGDGRILACGGWYEDADTGNRVLVDTVDCYRTDHDSWHTLTRVPTPRYHAGIVHVHSTIYFIGGFHSDAMFDRATAVVECYNLDTDEWTTGEKYPADIWEHTCVTLYIPRCRDDMEVMPSPPTS